MAFPPLIGMVEVKALWVGRRQCGGDDGCAYINDSMEPMSV